ncbi:Permease of the drug/metabolite transporter (DMT) superfamily [Jannaschia faecimaris]|uniref:Permease of the drug/metabolite transporter (DMT) superfamily n=1 Tax=Jannaschia faecimaris TaxID=1244108 RepID=A0A1H3RX64_9RHOB|nr:DMT family transporter [Jannaschia faecimaris]SDZ30217.1 Permease of the drug/metabolite transporter (DMT) superfamily [Jannaschia faecimaris]
MSTRDIPNRAWVALALLALIWGGSFLAIRTALDEISFVTSVAYRVGIAALVLWGWVAMRRLAVPRDPRIWGALLVMGILNNALPFSLMAWGQLHIETGLTSILNAGTAVFGVLVAALLLADERLTRRRAVGVGLGFFGVATAIGLENLTALDLRSAAQLAVVAGTVFYALAGVWGRVKLQGLDPEVSAAGMLTGSSLLMIPAALLVDGPVLPHDPATWLAIGYYAVAATAIAYLLYFRVLAMAGSGNTMLSTLLVAPVAILLGAWVRDEVLSPNVYLGFALLACGLGIMDGRILRVFRRSVTPGP